MGILRKIVKRLNPFFWRKRFLIKKLLKQHDLPDEEYLKKMFKLKMGYELDLSNPKTFNEKLNYLKIHNRDPIYTKMVDKHDVKEYVGSIIGKDYIIEEIGVFNNTSEIHLSKLPDKFVMKTTHGSGGVVVCKDKSKIDWNKVFKEFDKSLKHSYYYAFREWPYKDIKPRIVIEKFMSDGKNDVLPVYKFFCFGGKPVLLQAIKNDKMTNETIDYFDMNWNLLDLIQNFKNSKKPLEKPANFEEMKEIASKLSRGFPFIRVDLYLIDGRTYFSEFTFYSDAGFERFHPNKWDLELGNLIEIPELK